MTIPRIPSYPMPTEADLPQNRVDWRPEARRAALLIHDMQGYFLDFFDSAQPPVPALLANINALRNVCDALDIPVIYSLQPGQQTREERGLLQDWWGPGITAARPDRVPVVGELAPRERHTLLTKWRYSAFTKTDLLARLQAEGRDQLMVCGIYGHIGVMMTTAEGFMNDIQPFLIGDAVADFSPEDHKMTLNHVSRRCGVVLSTAQACAALFAGVKEGAHVRSCFKV